MDETTAQERSLRIGDSLVGRSIYSICRGFVRVVVYPLYRIEIHGKENLSLPGPVIVAPVHRSFLDIPIIGSGSKRRVRSLAKLDLFKKPAIAWFLSCLGGYPVRRGSADREALKVSIEMLERGELMIVYPEGTRRSGPEVEDLFDGCAYLAGKTGAVVVPVGIAGTEDAMPKNKMIPRLTKIVIHVGEPLAAPGGEGRVTKSQRAEFSEQLRVELQKLFAAARAEAGDTGGQ